MKATENQNPKISILGYLTRYRKPYLIGACLLFATNLFALGIPWMIKLAVEEIQGSPDMAFLNSCALYILSFAVAYAFLRIFSRIVIFGAGRDIEASIRQKLYDHLQTLDGFFFDKNPSGEMISLLTNDTNVVRLVFGMGFLNLVNGFLLYVMGAGVMFALNPSLTLWALLPYVLVIFLLRKITPQFHIRSREQQEKIASLTEFVQENLSGQEVIRGFSCRSSEEKRFSQFNSQYLQSSMALTKVRGLLFTSTGAIGGLGTLLLLWVGGKQVIQGTMGMGDFVAFFGYLTLLVSPTLMFGFVLSIWQRARASMERIQNLLEIRPSVVGHDPAVLWQGKANIRIQNLSFSYPSSESNSINGKKGSLVLDQISFEIKENNLTALVGPVGCGKSTLVSLLSRFYPVGVNQILLNGVDINAYSLSQLRKIISVVPQDSFLFSLSVRENIGFGLIEPNDLNLTSLSNLSKVEDAASHARVGLVKGERKFSLDTLVGERGTLLSGGQKQRIGIARSLVTQAPIILLDDPFSSLDADTAQRVMNSIRSSLKGHTVLLITHKISLIKNANQILVMDQGRIIDSGTHVKLMEQSKTYQNLYALEKMKNV